MTQLYWQTIGDGGEPAVALHCALGQGSAWAGVAKACAGRATFQACDLPGHGRSPDYVEDQGDFQGAAADAVAHHMGRTPAHIIGHSFGGTVALRLAVTHPELIKSLTLIEPVMFAAAFIDAPQARALYHKAFDASGDALTAGDAMQSTRIFMNTWGSTPAFDDLSPRQQQALADRIHMIPAQSPGIVDDVGGIMAPGVLEALDCPVTLIEGANTLPLVGMVQSALQARFRHVRRVIVPGAGHMVPLTHPGDVARAFLATL